MFFLPGLKRSLIPVKLKLLRPPPVRRTLPVLLISSDTTKLEVRSTPIVAKLTPFEFLQQVFERAGAVSKEELWCLEV
jgi:hypothetical protein